MSDSTSRYRVLILCNLQINNANTIADHLRAFAEYSQHRIFFFDTYLSVAPPRWLDINSFDVLVIHYSLYTIGDSYLSVRWRDSIQKFTGLKVMFIQDEYRTINAIIQRMKELEIRVLFTCFPESVIEQVYPVAVLPGVRKINTLTGYVPPALALSEPPWDMASRPIDVGYRARGVGHYHLGELYQQKSRIGERFSQLAHPVGLRCDISCSEKDRIYGEAWLTFMRSCKCTLGTESGASVLDFTGEIENRISAYCKAHPQASFEEVQALFLEEHEYRVPMNQISPRIFEAIGCGCALILFEGKYSGILVSERHYIPLKKDFSNFDSVVAQIGDHASLQQMVRRAYDDIIKTGLYSYQQFVSQVDSILEEEMQGCRGVLPSPPVPPRTAYIRHFARQCVVGLARCSGNAILFAANVPLHAARYCVDVSLRVARFLVGAVLNRASTAYSRLRLGKYRHPLMKESLRCLERDQLRLRISGVRLTCRRRNQYRENTVVEGQLRIDDANREFWDELCGSGMARELGIKDHSPESLAKFDAAYLSYYPYLLERVPIDRVAGKKVVEIGLGYGTLGQVLAKSARTYVGVDIAAKPVRMMCERLRIAGLQHTAVQGSALNLPFASESLDAVVSIGCLHHTGDLPRCLREIYRVLRPGGFTCLMLYNKFSTRQWNRWPGKTFVGLLHDYGLRNGKARVCDEQRDAYDAGAGGCGAPETEFFSIREIRQLMSNFRSVSCQKENCDAFVSEGRVIVSRERLLPWCGRYLGLDIYLVAEK